MELPFIKVVRPGARFDKYIEGSRITCDIDSRRFQDFIFQYSFACGCLTMAHKTNLSFGSFFINTSRVRLN